MKIKVPVKYAEKYLQAGWMVHFRPEKIGPANFGLTNENKYATVENINNTFVGITVKTIRLMKKQLEDGGNLPIEAGSQKLYTFPIRRI